MNTLIAVAIAPFGVGDELSAHVAEACKVIADSGLKYKTCSMFTEIEGEWDEVMKCVKDATMVLAEKGGHPSWLHEHHGRKNRKAQRTAGEIR